MDAGKKLRGGAAMRVYRYVAGAALVVWAVAQAPLAAQQAAAPLETIAYEVRDLLQQAQVFDLGAPTASLLSENERRHFDDAERATRLVQAVVKFVDLRPTASSEEAISVVNGSRLVVRTTALKHAEVKSLLNAYRQLIGVWVIARADLYEVDEAFHGKLKSAKHAGREELEEQEKNFLDGVPLPSDPLFASLSKQKPVLAGDEVKIDSGAQVLLLAQQRTITCLPGRAQILRGDKSAQAVLTGVSFHGGAHVSADRRFARMRITEKVTEVARIQRMKQVVDNAGGEAEYDVPLLTTATHTQEFEMPDGGSTLLPVAHRSKELREKGRWWVLKLTPRIYIEEEERVIREQMK
jgi:hypothetical protein